MRVSRHETIDSTNLEAHRLVAAGEQGPLWIVAGEQTAGRGRLGRTWVSKPGNLYATLIWPTAAPVQTLSQLSFVASLAVADAAERFADPGAVSLKWPNDCLLNGHKFCGILAESLHSRALEAFRGGLVALGIGINVDYVPDNLPYRAERLAGADLHQLFQELAASVSKWLEIWDEGRGFPQIIAAWEKRCRHIGMWVKIGEEQGTFTGLAPDGALLLKKSASEIKPIYAGDVRVEYQNA